MRLLFRLSYHHHPDIYYLCFGWAFFKMTELKSKTSIFKKTIRPLWKGLLTLLGLIISAPILDFFTGHKIISRFIKWIWENIVLFFTSSISIHLWVFCLMVIIISPIIIFFAYVFILSFFTKDKNELITPNSK